MNTADEKGTSVFDNGLIWFGAAASIAEILTGACLAPLGFTRGILAVLLGHGIGCLLLFFAGLLGGLTKKSAMETVKASFGQKGGLFFAFLNILQLAGWTGIMVFDGALAANEVIAGGNWFWCLVIGALIIRWIMIGITNLGKINSFAMAALLLLSLILCKVIFFGEGGGAASMMETKPLSFGAAVELSVAMPLSWLPLISDYTREAEKPVRATAVSAIVYGLVSSWMYMIGMGAAIMTGEGDIAQILLKAGLGIAGLLIVVLSTVTTTFLDAFSAGVSAESLHKKIRGKYAAVLITAAGTVAAILFPIYDITAFLYFIGSVFAPMIAIQIADFFLLKRKTDGESFNLRNLGIWLAGLIVYRLLMKLDLAPGVTLPDMLITAALCLLLPRDSTDKAGKEYLR